MNKIFKGLFNGGDSYDENRNFYGYSTSWRISTRGGPGFGVRRPDGSGGRPADSGEREAPGRAEGRGLLPRRVHHPGRAEAGGGGLPGGGDGRGDRRL